MPALNPFATKSRGFRGSSAPKTPEPFADGDPQPPSPPRQRFRLRKRNTSQANVPTGPTQQFLASVATADVPIPSIEEPCVLDEDMVDTAYPDIPFSEHTPFGRAFSPKTPAPAGFSYQEFPDWSMNPAEHDLEAVSECEISRPSTARSTQTESSLFSHLSFNSHTSSQNVSPRIDQADRLDALLPSEDYDKTIRPPKAATRKAQWTPAMSQHLWATYILYLQDPKVTPFRTSRSGIPPEGVCIRVTRVAMRQWKGPQFQAAARSGSTTPTMLGLGPSVAWPHTHAATRTHLRELCKGNGRITNINRQNPAASPTPMSRTVKRSQARRTPLRSPSIFSPSDMAMSLALSTSESMQLQGPLAELTRSQPQPQPQPQSMLEQLPLPSAEERAPAPPKTPEPARERLGSPFMANSYGPSSSNPAASLSAISERQSRSLRSPPPLHRTQPNLAKRRGRAEILESRRSKRPTLAADFWDAPSSFERQTSVPAPTAPLVEFSSTATSPRDSLFVPRTNLQELFEASQPGQTFAETTTTGQQTGMPPRLGSPFSATNNSLSVPNRISNPSRINLGAVRRPFATFQQSSSAEPTTPVRSSLASRLAYIDERLKDFRRRDHTRRRSQSPL